MARAVDGRRKAVVKLGSGDGPLSVRGRPSTVKGPLHPLRSETKGQAEGCPDRTRAIPCTVQAVTERASG